MTPECEAHLKRVIAEANELISAKYRKGYEKHGGDLLNMSLHRVIDEAINEAMDQVVYLLTLREKLHACMNTARK